MNPVFLRRTSTLYHAELLNRRWLSPAAFEVKFTKPASFSFAPGQRIQFIHEEIDREYSLVSTPLDDTISLCIRLVKGGKFSSALATAKKGDVFTFRGPLGYFKFVPSPRQAVFVATGTGIAPFVSMSRSGVKGFTLLHGVPDAGNLYYRELFESIQCEYIPCLSKALEGENVFSGRVTDYINRMMPRIPYDFYLCGRGDMVRDVTLIVDELFTGSLLYTETFY
jgi:benzoate/toluate 1,2-dioxygenase reductase component